LLSTCSLSLIPLHASPTMNWQQKAAISTVAAIPLLFGGHQISEGFVWTDFENEAAVKCFAFTAYSFWPFYISFALCFTEWTRSPVRQNHWSFWPRNLSDNFRRCMQLFHASAGVVLLAVVLSKMIPIDTDDVEDVNGRLRYEGWDIHSKENMFASIVYAYVVVMSLVVSSLPYSTLFAELALASLVVTLILWKHEYPSTWCFFAALLSSIIIIVVWHELQLYRGQTEDKPEDGECTENSLSQGQLDEATSERRSKCQVAMVKEYRTASEDLDDLTRMETGTPEDSINAGL
jgi:hypothetical protein